MKRLIIILILLIATPLWAGDVSSIMGKAIASVATICGKAKAAVASWGGGGVPVAGGGGTTFLSDTFTETSDEYIESHSPETGSTWVPVTNSILLVSSSPDYVYVESGTDRQTAYNAATPTDNTYYVLATGTCGASSSIDEFGALGRWDAGSSGDGYMCKIRGDGYVVLRLYESGATTDIAEELITGWFTATTVYKIKLILAGNSYGNISCQVYEGATLKTTITADDHTVETRTGKAGIYLRNTGTSYITEVQATDQ